MDDTGLLSRGYRTAGRTRWTDFDEWTGEIRMESRDIFITKFDFRRLKKLLLEVGITLKKRDRDYVESLRNELEGLTSSSRPRFLMT